MTVRRRRIGCRRLAATIGVLVALVLALGSAACFAQAPKSSAPRVLDRFDDLALWKATASDGANASIHAAAGSQGLGMRVDFDLGGTAGYALAARPLDLDLPPNYEIAFDLRADAQVNDFQVKLVDAGGENVWWFRRANFAFPREWQRITIRKRQIEFAWGPTKDRILAHAARLEFVVAAGSGGGTGSIYISHLTLRERPPEPAAWEAPLVQASSSIAAAAPSLVVDGRADTAWKSDPADGAEQQLTFDFGQPREFGGLVLRWQPGAFASRYDVQFSDDAQQWRTVRSVVAGRGGIDALLLSDAEARYVRLAFHDGPMRAYGLAEVEVRGLAFGASPNAFFEALAREYPRGYFARGFSGEQSYWTIVGIEGGSDTGLLSEDGALEVAKGGFSIEPFVRTDSGIVSWADVQSRHSLLDDYLPIPSVTWQRKPWSLRVTAFASGIRAESHLFARYEVRNLTERPLSLELVLAIRPSQVNPPAQFLNAPGGVAAIRDIAWQDGALTINEERRIYPLMRPQRVGAFAFDSGPIRKLIAPRTWSGPVRVHDAFGYASAALNYPIRLAPGASATIALAMPLSGEARPPAMGRLASNAWIAREHDAVAALWRQSLNDVGLTVPAVAKPLADTLRTALAHVLITRDGPILRPGTRAYARSWIRDGAMIGDSLLRLGRADVAEDYLRWFAQYQFASGKIPCCVDARGADPVPENDSAGEFVFLTNEIHRYSADRTLLVAMWPRVQWAMRYLERLRQSERTRANRAAPGYLYGLLPASISHEGYAEKPMHSYWDDFWALKAYNAAIDIAVALGESGQAQAWREQRAEFARDLEASLLASTAAHRIGYLPGAAELGDFDPASSTIALAPAGDLEPIPTQLIDPTFERYWNEFVDRRDGRKAWEDYTPYELRTVGSFVRLGWRDRAQELLTFFMADRRPAAWNQWAEVVGRDARKVRFVGDMPHAWIASDFIRAVLDLFAYERSGDHALVIAAAVPPEWLRGRGIALSGLYTPFGRLSYSLRDDGRRIVMHVNGTVRLPAGGIVLPWPGSGSPGATYINGKRATWREGELRIADLPADVVVEPQKRGKP
jgi:hypothetical protein